MQARFPKIKKVMFLEDETLFLGISGAGLSIPLFFSSREGLVHRENRQAKSEG
jgi:hypothetical protein